MDIFPPPVSWTPPNCVFEVDDVQREWTWRDPFDFIHMRQLLGAFSAEGWDTLYQQCYKSVFLSMQRDSRAIDSRAIANDVLLQRPETRRMD